jgi:hypothetical protein
MSGGTVVRQPNARVETLAEHIDQRLLGGDLQFNTRVTAQIA